MRNPTTGIAGCCCARTESGHATAAPPYATTIFDYVRRSMPLTAPQALSNGEVYAVTAYLLHLNGIIGERDAIDAESLPRVKMPNQNNFKSFYFERTP